MILIKGGRVIDPEKKKEWKADVALDGQKIAAIGEIEDDGTYEQVIDAEGLVVAPGLVDVHVHFRDPGLTYKEDIQTGAKASAAGGFTTVVCMANTKPPVDNVETLQHVIAEGKKTGIHVLADATVSVGMKGETLVDMDALRAAGAAGFTDDQLGIYGSPALAEDSLAARDCMIALHTGATVNIQHISSRYSVEAVRLAKRLGADVWAEVTPHHFTLTEDAVLTYGTLAKMNPPLRTEEDRQALIAALKDGTIDMIATDHAPHAAEEKEKPLTEAPSGITGIETSLALAITNLVKPGHLTLPELMEKMSLNPARLYRLDCGRMAEGAPADLVIFDPDEEWVVEHFYSKASNSPFKGWKLTGKVKKTICDGKVVYED